MAKKDKAGTTTYKHAGVDIDKGNALVERIKPFAARTKRPEVLGNLGSFGALCKIPKRYKQPVLVTATDGVGTKLDIALATNQHQGIGIDLVAMCVNDLIVCGAEPLTFLDYYATGQLDLDQASCVVESIAEGCIQAGCALVGGETAEMPGMYSGSSYDLAGFCVGVVEEDKILTPDLIQAGDTLIGLASSGPHSNGYSLIRRLIEDAGLTYNDEVEGHLLKDVLLEPTRIYVKTVLKLLQTNNLKGIAHITGGGIYENLPRILPQGLGADINIKSWDMPWIFDWLGRLSNLESDEMYRTFNMGIGMILCVDAKSQGQVLEALSQAGETAYVIGEVTSSTEINLLT